MNAGRINAGRINAGRILVFCPLAPYPPRPHQAVLKSIFNLAWREQITVAFDREDSPARPGYANILEKYQRGRRLALDGGFDALLTVEADMILPELALMRLSRVEADVAYGLYCSRRPGHPWLCFTELAAGGGRSLSRDPEVAARLWGLVVESRGAGTGCTLIHRRVLEKIEFRLDEGGPAHDWWFALDCAAAGFVQKHDLGVQCGHLTHDGEPLVVWPDPCAPGLFRKEALRG